LKNNQQLKGELVYGVVFLEIGKFKCKYFCLSLILSFLDHRYSTDYPCDHEQSGTAPDLFAAFCNNTHKHDKGSIRGPQTT
jgi:hypothetical protein